MLQLRDEVSRSELSAVLGDLRRGSPSLGEGASGGGALGLSYGSYVGGVPVLEASGHLVTQRIRFGVSAPGRRSWRRGAITPWTNGSRRRLRWTFQRCQWEKFGSEWVIVTLTLPGKDVEMEMDGRVIKAWFQAFRRRWERAYGGWVGVWKLEFQARGAAHFAVVLPSPVPAVATSPLGLTSLREWVSRAWYEVVGSGSAAHLRAGTQVMPVRDVRRVGSYIAGYMLKSGRSKEYQHVVPKGYHHVGRWWSAFGGLVAPVTTFVQTPEQAYRTRRALACSVRARSPGYGQWVDRARRKRVSTIRYYSRRDAVSLCRGLMELRR